MGSLSYRSQCADSACPILPIAYQLKQEEARRIASLGLCLNEPEPAILCTECGFALKADSDRVSRHLGEKHGLSKSTRWGLNKLIN